MTEFKDRIKELRTERNLTQSQLAVKINRGEATIRAWETGRAKPDAEMLISLSKLFSCTVDYLLGISDIKSSAQEDIVKAQILKLKEEIDIMSGTREKLKQKEEQLKKDTLEIYQLKESRKKNIAQIYSSLNEIKNRVNISMISQNLKDQLDMELDKLYAQLEYEIKYQKDIDADSKK